MKVIIENDSSHDRLVNLARLAHVVQTPLAWDKVYVKWQGIQVEATALTPESIVEKWYKAKEYVDRVDA